MPRRIEKIQKTISMSATNNTVGTATIPLSGKILAVKTKTPATVDSSATITNAITDSDGDSIYSKSSLAVNTTTAENQDSNHVPFQFPIAGTITITVTASATQTIPRNVVVTLLVDQYV